MLFIVGPLAIQAGYRGVNADEAGGEVGGAFAEKSVLGRRPPLEDVGEAPETAKISGALLPFKLGGLGELEVAKGIVRRRRPVSVHRGDGGWSGFYVIEKLTDTHTFLHINGVGQLVKYELELKRDDPPSAAGFVFDIMSLIP